MGCCRGAMKGNRPGLEDGGGALGVGGARSAIRDFRSQVTIMKIVTKSLSLQ